MPRAPFSRNLLITVTLLLFALPLVADEMDDANGDPPGTHQGRVDDIVAALNADADPNDVVPDISDYVGYYTPSGTYEAGFDFYATVTEPPGIFAEPYQRWLTRLRLRIRDLLRSCDPSGFKEALDYLLFHEIGYGDVVAETFEEKVERSEEFGAAYRRWMWRDQARQQLRDGDGEEGALIDDLEALLGTLRDEDLETAERIRAAGRLGTIDPSAVDLDLLRQRLADEDSGEDSLVRYWAASTLGRGPRPLEAVEELLTALEDASWPMRVFCASVLAQGGNKTGEELLSVLEAHRDAEVDRWPERSTTLPESR